MGISPKYSVRVKKHGQIMSLARNLLLISNGDQGTVGLALRRNVAKVPHGNLTRRANDLFEPLKINVVDYVNFVTHTTSLPYNRCFVTTLSPNFAS